MRLVPKLRLTSSTQRRFQRLVAFLVTSMLMLTTTLAGVAAQPAPNSGDGSADNPGTSGTSTTAWIIRRTSLAQTRQATFRKGLRDALRTHSGTHIVGRADLAELVSQNAATVPTCLFGVKTCGSALSVTLEHLDVDTLVRLEVDPADDAGTTDKVRASYTLVDRTGEPRRQMDVAGESTRDLAFAIVRDIFDATATIRVTSTPSEADVFIDDERIGSTPLEQRVPIGQHSYRVELNHHATQTGEVELSADSTRSIDVALEPNPATLQVQGAPDGAVVFIDGEERGLARDPVELKPGDHALTVRADGYSPVEQQVQAKPGDSLQVTAPLERESRWLKDIATDAIASNRYILRFSGSFGLHKTTFRDARTDIDNGQLEFGGFRTDNGIRPLSDTVRRTALPLGMQLDLGYSGRNLGVILASMSYSGASMNRKAELIRRTDSGRQPIGATVEGVRRFQLRPLQIRYRHFFKNFVPTIEAGTGISFQWVRVRPNDTDRREVLHHTEAFWTIGAGAQYFFTPRIFILGRYNVQDYFNAGRGVEHVLNIGAGMTFPNVFGIEPRPPETLD
jgi:hypothetical protein